MKNLYYIFALFLTAGIIPSNLSAQVSGTPGTTLNFDGSNDYVNVPDNNALDLINTYTIEAWIKPETFTRYGGIVSKFDNNNGYFLDLRADGNGRGFYFDGWQTADNILEANQWYHVAVVKNNGTRHLYLNGVEKTLTDMGSYTITANNNPLCIGRSKDNGGNPKYFDGSIDEVRIWNVERSQQEIRENLHKTLDGTESGLVCYFQFNNGSGSSTLTDVVGGHHGTLSNMDVNNSWVTSTIPTGGGYSNTQSVSAAGSVTFTSTGINANFSAFSGSSDIIVTKIEHAPNILPSADEVLNSQYWVINKFGSSTFTSDLTFTVGETFSAEDIANPNRIKLYSRSSNSEGSWTLTASAVTVTEHQVTFSGLQSFSQFIIGRKTSAPETTPGSALHFAGNGSQDYVSGSGLPTGMSAVTLEAWIYHSTLPASIQRYVTVGNEVAGIRHDGSGENPGRLHFFIKLPGGGTWGASMNNALEINKWYHVAGVTDGNTMKLYLNGELVKTSAPASSLYSNDGNFLISASGETMDGYIDEVRIWDVMRTEQEIRENIHKTLSGNESGLVSYFQFNDGTGSGTLNDIAGDHNGTLNNMNINFCWSNSTIPMGEGTSSSSNSFTNGIAYLGNVQLTTTDGFDAEVNLVNTEINRLPNSTFGITGNVLNKYYVLKAYPASGTPGSFAANLTFTLPEGSISSEDQTTPANLRLYKREGNSDGNWSFVKSASSATSTKVTFTGITSFSQFIIASESSPLPVELISFTAKQKNNTVTLEWKTATEVNNYGFEIERQTPLNPPLIKGGHRGVGRRLDLWKVQEIPIHQRNIYSRINR